MPRPRPCAEQALDHAQRGQTTGLMATLGTKAGERRRRGKARSAPPEQTGCRRSRPGDAGRTRSSAHCQQHAGQVGRRRCIVKITAATPSPIATAAGVMVPRPWNSATSFGANRPGSPPASVSPPRSLSWLARMVTAMAQVNPTVTAWGMWRTRPPSRANPIAASMIPERKTAHSRPSRPYLAAVAATSTMNAPAGPPIW